ncbi:MAG TPA: hypothetical protein PKL28_15460 [Rhodocyclaceae bacterium]|jgi:hypothetical protein|nr:hypothetical protein [Rhodocyclaceae bacterium]HNM82453.1 hypothetical protein [Rhodocyclaceae bacterium]
MKSSPLFAALSLMTLIALPGAAMAATACSLLSSQDAATLAGVALPENFKAETPPTRENGNDHTTVCGWFPKGYNLATAAGAPEAGVQLTVHDMKTPAEAKTFHTHSAEMTREIAKSGPLAGKISAPAGLGDNAVLDVKTLQGNAQVATLQFFKGSAALQIQAWSKGPGAGEVATKAAKQVAGKL